MKFFCVSLLVLVCVLCYVHSSEAAKHKKLAKEEKEPKKVGVKAAATKNKGAGKEEEVDEKQKQQKRKVEPKKAEEKVVKHKDVPTKKGAKDKKPQGKEHKKKEGEPGKKVAGQKLVVEKTVTYEATRQVDNKVQDLAAGKQKPKTINVYENQQQQQADDGVKTLHHDEYEL